jgi:hypothetical protein
MGFWEKFNKEGFEYEISNEEVIEKVKAAGYEVVEATDRQLFLDIDSEEQYEVFMDRFALFNRFFAGETMELPFTLRPSIGGLPGRHIVIELPEPMPILERIAWQAAMGSDPKKEFNNLLGVHFNIPHHIVLFNRPKESADLPERPRKRGVHK